MNESVLKDIKAVLDDSYSAIQLKKYYLLHDLSEHVIHSMSVYQDRETADCSVIIFALSKMLEREKYTEHSDMPKFLDTILSEIDKARNAIPKNDISTLRDSLKNLIDAISEFDRKLKLFDQPVLEYAKLQKATKLVHHGLSANQAATYMQIPEWELLSAIGHTTTSEMHPSTPITNRARLELVRRLFNT